MNKIIELLNKSDNIALFTHTKPDPDAIGSVGAMNFALKQLNKNVTVFVEENLPSNLNFIQFDNMSFELPDVQKFDLAIALDIANLSLLTKFEKQFVNFKNSVCIDHHPMRQQIAKYDFVQTSACATAEILFDLFIKMSVKITPEIADCLYAGIAGDTGRFLHSNTNARTFEISKTLIESGAKIFDINNILFAKITKELVLASKILYNNLDFKGNILFSYLSLNDFKKEKIKPASSADLIGLLNGIEDIDIIVVLNEKNKNEINVSLRSTANYNVSIVAKHFGGGGHKQASGFQKLEGDIFKLKETVYDYIQKNIEKIKIK